MCYNDLIKLIRNTLWEYPNECDSDDVTRRFVRALKAKLVDLASPELSTDWFEICAENIDVCRGYLRNDRQLTEEFYIALTTIEMIFPEASVEILQDLKDLLTLGVIPTTE